LSFNIIIYEPRLGLVFVGESLVRFKV